MFKSGWVVIEGGVVGRKTACCFAAGVDYQHCKNLVTGYSMRALPLGGHILSANKERQRLCFIYVIICSALWQILTICGFEARRRSRRALTTLGIIVSS